MTEAEVEAYRRKREIMVKGRDVPKPVREFRDVPKPVTMPLHPPPRCLQQGKGGREGGREGEREEEEEGERAARGPPLTQEPNRLPYTGSDQTTCLSARHARAPGTSPHRCWGGIRWGPTGLPPADYATTTKRWREEEETREGEEKRRKKEEERKKRNRKEKEGGRRQRPALGRSLVARQALGGSSGGPRLPSTSLSPCSGEPGETEGGREGGREKERERRGGEDHRRPSPHTGAKPASVDWFGPGDMLAGSLCLSLGHQPPPALGRHPMGSGRPPTSRPCHCHQDVVGGRRNKGRRRKEKKEGRRKEERKRKEKEGGCHWRSALGRLLVARQAP